MSNLPEVSESLPGAQSLFDWDRNGWMLFVDKEKGFEKLVKGLAESHFLNSNPAQLMSLETELDAEASRN